MQSILIFLLVRTFFLHAHATPVEPASNVTKKVVEQNEFTSSAIREVSLFELKPSESCTALKVLYENTPEVTFFLIDNLLDALEDIKSRKPIADCPRVFDMIPDGDVVNMKEFFPVPPIIALDSSMINEEAFSLYWYYRTIRNLFDMSPCNINSSSPNITGNPNSTWLVSDILSVNETDGNPGSYTIPLTAVIRDQNDSSRISVIIRGTLNKYEWIQDFSYQQVQDSRFPGTVHSGFLGLFNQLEQNGLFETVASPGASNIAISGHSLGAALSTLVAYHLRNTLPDKKISAILFAPPNVGDQTFANACNQIVNTRRVSYTNDLVPQLPCDPTMPKCTDGKANGIYGFSHVGVVR